MVYRKAFRRIGSGPEEPAPVLCMTALSLGGGASADGDAIVTGVVDVAAVLISCTQPPRSRAVSLAFARTSCSGVK